MISGRLYLLIGLPLLTLLSACAPAPRIPVDTLWYANETSRGSRCLFVFLPGRWDSHKDFLARGFIGSVREHRVPVDMTAVDLHIGYYRAGSALERLQEDVLRPSRRRGYRNIWLIGISLGGLGSLAFETRYPREISGIVLLAPFLGDMELAHEIQLAGGVLAWRPGKMANDDYQRRLWEWVQHYAKSGSMQPPIYLGFGNADRLAASQRLLAAVLPPERVVIRDGGHDWVTWKLLWDALVERLAPQLQPCADPQ